MYSDQHKEHCLLNRDTQENIDTCLSCTSKRCAGECGKMKKRNKKPIDEVMALELYKQGLNDREIAEKLGVHQTAIQKWRVKNGIDRRRSGEQRKER